MADVRYEVNNYDVMIYGRKAEGSSVRERAQIRLLSASVTGVAGRLYFFAPEVADSKTDRVSYGCIVANMSVTEMGAVIDLLRNEKPIWINWYDWAGHAMLTTGSEPIGEAEA